MSAHQGRFWARLSLDGVPVATLELTGGTVTQDFNAAARRTCQIEFPAWGTFAGKGSIVPDVQPAGSDQRFGQLRFGDNIFGDSIYDEVIGYLLPMRSRVTIYADYSATGGPQETLGVFTLGQPTWEVAADGVFVTVSGWDVAADIAATAFDQVATVSSGNTVDGAIALTLFRYLPEGVSVSLPSTSVVGSYTTYVPGSGSTPWRVAQEYADLAGWQLFVNRDGNRVNAANKPDPSNYPAPSWTLDERTNLLTAALTTDAREICNTVVVSGDAAEGDATWARAENINGPFGTATTGMRMVREYSSDKAKTQADCQYLANLYLREWSRLAQTVTGTCAPEPRMEVGQTVTIISSDLGLGSGDVYFLERLEVPLDPTQPYTFTASRKLQ